MRTPGEQVTAACQQAMALHQQGRPPEARAGYQRVLQLQPQNATALTLLGVIALQDNDPDGAVDLFGRALEVEPQNMLAHVNRTRESLPPASLALG